MSILPARRRSRATLLLAAAVAVLGALPAGREAAAADDPTIVALMAQKSPAVVSVKFVLKMKLSFGGQSQDQESSTEIRGTVVDGSGLVLVANDSLEGGLTQQQRTMFKTRGIEFSASPADLKVLFGNEAKEHDAAIVARDSNLGLCFIQIMDQALDPTVAKPPGVVDLSQGGEAGVGQAVFVVTRKPRGFDCAPVFARLFVSGRVEKPRPMFAITGSGAQAGLPVFDAAGTVLGVIASQGGAEGVEGGASDTFLLPLDAVRKVMEQAKKRIPELVEKAKTARDAAKEPAMDEPKDAPKEPAMGETPDAPPAEPKPK